MARSEIDRILDQMQRAYDGRAWHGASLRALLDGVTAPHAAARPLPTRHSIWELVNHIAAWKQFAARGLSGNALPDDPAPEIDWPPVANPEATAWHAALAHLDTEHRRLIECVDTLSDRDLGRTVGGRDYSYYILAHGVIQHDLYHAGQIALLRTSSPKA